MSLRSRLILRGSLGLLLYGAMLFVPAGTLRFWQAWIFLGISLAFILLVFGYFYRHDRNLLERRMQRKEKRPEQRRLVQLMRPAFLVVGILPGLDHRWGWSHVPAWLSVAADVVLAVGLALIFWVTKVNSFASRTIQVEAGQPVISIGPYALVRHPMYLGCILLWLAMPLALGTYVAWPAFALLAPFYVVRLLHEEKFLDKELPGYREYRLRTRFRLVPYLW